MFKIKNLLYVLLLSLILVLGACGSDDAAQDSENSPTADETAEGPPGTPFTITIKGSGWTEFDNALGVTYDNAYVGYVCAFESQGTLTIPLVASGDPGYHLVDIYPSIYQGQRELPDIYRKPQLTYQEDHPGTGVPAIRTFFKVTEE